METQYPTLTEKQLKAIVAGVRVLLAAKVGCRIYLRPFSAGSLFIVERPGKQDYWTVNESQAVEVYNEVATYQKAS